MFLFDLIFLQRQSKAAVPAAKRETPPRSPRPSGRETGKRAEEIPSAGPEFRENVLPREEPLRREDPPRRENVSPREDVLREEPLRRESASRREDPFRREGGEAFFFGEGRREFSDAAGTAANLDAIAECAAKQVRLLRKMTDLMRSQADGTYYL